jgi:hypothetical protein
VIHQPPDSVWSAIRDFAGLSEWWSDMKQVERRNPLFRVMGTVMGLDATIKQYLRALGRRFGEEVDPV